MRVILPPPKGSWLVCEVQSELLTCAYYRFHQPSNAGNLDGKNTSSQSDNLNSLLNSR